MVERGTARLKREQLPAERDEIVRLRRLHDLSFDAAWRAINTGRTAPNVVLEAVVVAVRERGFKALEEPKNVDRMARLDEAGRRKLDRRLRKLKKDNQVGVGLPAPEPSARRFAAEMEADPAFQRIWRPAVDQFHGHLLATPPMAGGKAKR
jgi:hypothetical protein